MTTIYNGQFWHAKIQNIEEGMLYKRTSYMHMKGQMESKE